MKKSAEKTAKSIKAFNPYDPAFNPVQDAITLCIVVLTCLVQCLILNAFYTPYHMLSGGITGIAILLDYTASIPRWVTLVVLNIPVLIIGAKRVNVKFIVFSAIGTICYSVMFSLPFVRDFTIDLGENSELLSVIVGAALIGASGVPVVKRGATLGGMDILNVILSRRLSVPMGNICICYNIVIMAALGVLFAYKLMMPFMLRFLSTGIEGAEYIQTTTSIESYVNLCLTMFIIFGCVFEMPLITIILSKMGIINPQILKQVRGVAIVVIFFIAAVVTPPDIVSQCMVAFPMVLLYFVSIFLSGIFYKPRDTDEDDEEEEESED